MLAKAVAGAYQTNDTPGWENCENPSAYIAEHKGFCGPICTKGTGGNAPPCGTGGDDPEQLAAAEEEMVRKWMASKKSRSSD